MVDKLILAHALLSPCGLPSEDFGHRRWDPRTPPPNAVIPSEWTLDDLIGADRRWEKTVEQRTKPAEILFAPAE